MVSKMLNQKIFGILKDAKNVFLFGDIDPDGLGAASAMAVVLRSLKKNYLHWGREEVPSGLSFIPGVNDISTSKEFDLEDFDVIISIDNGDLKKTGLRRGLKKVRENSHSIIINIDHHLSNDFFGHINMVNIRASASCEQMYYFYIDNCIPYSSSVAECLLTGIVGDTGNFSNNATNLKSLEIASKLMAKGVSLPHIVRAIIEPKKMDVAMLNLWGIVFSRLNYDESSGIATTVILQKDLKENNLDIEATEGISNFLNKVKDVKATMVLTELPDGKVKGSLRTTRDDADVSALAAKMGGGGHKKAAGFTVDGKLNQKGKGWEVSKLFKQQNIIN